MSVASLLDESTAAAEAMQMCFALKGKKGKKNKFFVSQDVHPQTIALIETRAGVIGIDVVVGDHSEADFSARVITAVPLFSIPTPTGAWNHLENPTRILRHAHTRMGPW